MQIILLGKPESTNHIYKYTCRGKFPTVYMTAKGKALKESYILQARVQKTGDILEGELETNIKIYFDSHRKHDIDNYSKILLDALSGIVWIDDEQIIKQTVEKDYDKANPRIEIGVKQYIKSQESIVIWGEPLRKDNK